MSPFDNIETTQVQSAESIETLVGGAGLPVDLPSDAPAYLVTVIHGLADSRVAITELRTGITMVLPETNAVPADPIWAPDSSSILFRNENELMYYDIRQNHLRHLASGLSPAGRTPYAYSPDGQLIAVAEANLIHVLPVTGGSRDDRGRFALPEGASFAQLLWAIDGQNLVVLTMPDDVGNSLLVWIDTLAQTTHVQPTANVIGLLGWDPPTRGLVVVRFGPERIGNEAAILLPSGEFRALRDAEEDEAGEFVLAYRSDTQQTIALLGREDLGDPAKLLILSPDNTPAQLWLKAFPRLGELSISADGHWVAFVDGSPVEDTGEAGGHIYIAPFGSENAILVLKADPESRTFATPVFSP